jgi:hypothetical protein
LNAAIEVALVDSTAALNDDGVGEEEELIKQTRNALSKSSIAAPSQQDKLDAYSYYVEDAALLANAVNVDDDDATSVASGCDGGSGYIEDMALSNKANANSGNDDDDAGSDKVYSTTMLGLDSSSPPISTVDAVTGAQITLHSKPRSDGALGTVSNSPSVRPKVSSFVTPERRSPMPVSFNVPPSSASSSTATPPPRAVKPRSLSPTSGLLKSSDSVGSQSSSSSNASAAAATGLGNSHTTANAATGGAANSNTTPDSGNWNLRFQQIFSVTQRFTTNTPQSEIMHWNLEMLHLSQVSASNLTFGSHVASQDFIYSCVTYGRIIISELYLPVEKKTIKPIDMGGVAGGTKYQALNIVFKFAVDDKGFYGSDYAAAKVAGCELRGLMAYFNCDVQNLHFPLMSLVDYRGFRLIAMSILPIDRTTLVYGSNDAGLTMHNKSTRLAGKMKQAARQLNLATHLAGRDARHGTEVHSASDLEGHVGHDNKCYLVDFSRAMPPETPVSGVQMGHLYRLLRPEFVRRYRQPLCSDAFSSFIKHFDSQRHCAVVREATQVCARACVCECVATRARSRCAQELIEVVIPAFAPKLVEQVS